MSATRWIDATIWSIEADVSLTLEACICVLFTMFCTLTLISCMVLVTSSMAEEACTLILADSSDAPATWLEPLATCDARIAYVLHQAAQALDHPLESVAQRVALRTRLHFDRQIAAGDGFRNRGHLLQVSHHVVEGAGQFADLVLAADVDVVVQVAGIADPAATFIRLVSGSVIDLGGAERNRRCPATERPAC